MAKQLENQEKDLNRKQVTRHEREAQLEQLLIRITIGVVAVIVLIIGFGAVNEYLLKPGRPVAQVNQQPITTQEFQARQRYERQMLLFQISRYNDYLNALPPNDEASNSTREQFQSYIQSLQNQLSDSQAFSKQILDRMVEEDLVRAEAQNRSLTIPDEEVEKEVEVMMGYDREADTDALTTTTTISRELYVENLDAFKKNILTPIQFSEADFRDMLRTSLLKSELQEVMGQDILTRTEQAETVFLMTPDETQAQDWQKRLNDQSITIEALLEEVEKDASDTTVAYQLPWYPPNYLKEQVGSSDFGSEVELAAFQTPIGQASAPISSTEMGRYNVIYVKGREVHDLSPSIMSQELSKKYEAWLTKQKETVVIKNWQAAVITEP